MNSDWNLTDFKIEQKRYGNDKGKYFGKITFKNDEMESFNFNITPEDSEQFLAIIADKVVETAEKLGQRIKADIQGRKAAGDE
jgi:hypothetical protein